MAASQKSIKDKERGALMVGLRFCGEHLIGHGRHWRLARYELPIKEVELKVGNHYVTDIVIGDNEKLAYVHRWTGKRVEFARPRYDNRTPYLDEARAKWECELAFAEEATAARRQKTSNIVGRIQLPKTNNQLVEAWKVRAKDPAWVKWPTRLHTPGAFGREAHR
jgi:hypothetical protein